MAQPTAQEQELLELLNRMRLNPSKELDYLLNPSNTEVQSALSFFKVDKNLLAQQWSKLTPAAALAWSDGLSNAATTHNQAMIAADTQSHQLPGEAGLGDRTLAAGYDFTTVRENVYAFADSIFYTHAGFAIDWGDGPGGIQNPAGHRESMMTSEVREVGMSVIAENNPNTQVGPLVVTQEFGNRSALNGKGYVLGVAFDDKNKDGFYQAGEGVNDVKVKFTGINGTSFDKTIDVWTAGGYQELLGAGNYQVDFLRNNQVIGTKTASIASGSAAQNVKLDLIVPLVDLTAPVVTTPTATTPAATTPTATTPAPVVSNPTPVVTTPVASNPTPEVLPAPVVNAPTAEVLPAPVVSNPTPEVSSGPVIPKDAPVIELTAEPIQKPVMVSDSETKSLLESLDNLMAILGNSLQDGSVESELLAFIKNTNNQNLNALTEKIQAKVLNVSSEAAYTNQVGLYAVLDAQGTVADLDGRTYKPGDRGYTQAALRRSQVAEEGVSFGRDGIAAGMATLKSGNIFAPFIIANGDISGVLEGTIDAGDVYFNYKAANSDGIDHIKSLGTNTFGFEDMRGGGDLDYNDMIFKVDASVLRSIPSLIGSAKA